MQRVDALETRLEELKSFQQQRSVVKQRIATAQTALAEAEEQQGLLVDLIAGRDRIRTFLALLDQLSRVSGVEIQQYEPIQDAKPAVASTGAPSSKKKASEKPSDPLMAMGYRKSSVALRVEGPYAGLKRFLQEMERLQILVESSDLSLTAIDSDGLGATTVLALRLSFYDRTPQSVDAVQLDAMPEELS